MSDQQEKVALSETTRAFVTPMVAGIAAGGVAYGLPAALDKVREVRVRRNRDQYITAMKDVHPDLKGIDKKDLHIAYNSLAMHSPHVLRDPLLGGQELLRMSRYRQADVNALNEINKLRGNSMMDQAFMNATNFVAGGITEGFKGYQAQRQADADQAYREKMDKARAQMEKARFDLEQDRFKVQKDQYRDSFNQRERQFEATFNQRENAAQYEDGYRKDRDAVADAKWQVEQARNDAKETREQISFENKYTQVTPYEVGGVQQYDPATGEPLYYSPVAGAGPARAAVAYHQRHPLPAGSAAGRTLPPTGVAARPKSSYTKKTASAHHLADIVARLRDRNL